MELRFSGGSVVASLHTSMVGRVVSPPYFGYFYRLTLLVVTASGHRLSYSPAALRAATAAEIADMNKEIDDGR